MTLTTETTSTGTTARGASSGSVSTILTDSIPSLVAELVAAGQPWCENSLDGPARPPEETRAAERIAPLLEELGFAVQLVGTTPTRLNLVATREFGPGPTILLNDHLDTYPAGPPSRWTKVENPYVAAVDGDRVYARGTSDTRGNLTALLRSVALLCQQPPSTGRLVVALTVDEERNGVEGALHLVRDVGLTADASITVEPTAWSDDTDEGIAIAVAHTGHALIDLRVDGISSHIWRPDTGVNSAHLLLTALASLRDEALPAGWQCSIVGLDAGERGMAQFTPLTASARLAVVGLGPDVTPAEVLDVVTRAARAAVSSTGVAGEVSVAFVNGPTFVAGTRTLDDDAPVVGALRAAYRSVTGEDARLYVKPAYCDTIRFSQAGIPAVTFGPGDDGWAVYDESISLARIELAAAVLADALGRFLASTP